MGENVTKKHKLTRVPNTSLFFSNKENHPMLSNALQIKISIFSSDGLLAQ